MCFRCSLGLKYVEMFHKQRKSKVALRLITWLHWYQSQMFYTYSTRVYKTASFLHSSSHSPQYINNSKLTLVLSIPLWLCAMILDSKGKTGGFFLLCVKQDVIPAPTALSPFPSLTCVCVCVFPPSVFYLQTPAPPPSHQEISKGLKAKQRLLPIPDGAARRSRLDVHHAQVKVHHLIPSELLQVFVHSQGLEVCIWVVFIISNCKQQQETTF